MAKAKQTIETDDVEIDDIAAESVIAELNGHQPDYRLIPIGYLETSPTNPRSGFPRRRSSNSQAASARREFSNRLS